MSNFNPTASPGIAIKEIDLTGVTPNVQSSIGAFAGDFNWGPANSARLVSSEAELVEQFGAPSATNAHFFLTAVSFLNYSGNLYVARGVDGNARNASSSATSALVQIDNEDSYEAAKGSFGADSGDLDTGMWIARYIGSLGNSVSVSICPAGEYADWDYKGFFDDEPGTSAWAANQNAATNDEIHVAVIDRTGKISGTKGAVLETFAFLSVALGAKRTDGASNYMPDVINRGSRYVYFGYFDGGSSVTGTYWGQEPSDATPTDYSDGVTWSNLTSTNALDDGADSIGVGSAELASAYALYADEDNINVDFLIACGLPTTLEQATVVTQLNSIAATQRRDCVAVTSPNIEAVVNNSAPVTSTLTTIDSFPASSYLIVDNNYLKVYDKYNDQYVYIPAAAATCGIMAATDLSYGPWYSPAGQKRGQYLGVTSLAYSATASERDTLYKVGVNPVVNLPGRGIVLYGDKTRENRPTAFNRINVRRLFLSIEKAIALAARNVMFEFNDEFTRSEFQNIIEPYLREIKGRRGITDFRVVCDETNNTPAVIDRNELVASIFVKPARSVNYITLNFVAVRTGVEFEEVVGTV